MIVRIVALSLILTLIMTTMMRSTKKIALTEALKETVEKLTSEKFETEIRAKEHAKTLMEVVNFNQISGLPNRDLFSIYLSTLLTKAKKENKQVLLFILTIRGFREISQAFGENTSREYLKVFSKILTAHLPNISGVGHIETTHFAIAELGDFQESQVENLAEWLMNIFKNPITVDEHAIATATNIGIALYPDDGDNAETLLTNAMIAINQAKEKGQNTIQFYKKGMSAKVEERRRLMADLQPALQKNEFILYYQPKVNLKSMKIDSAETLIRWQHKEKELISPSLFISLLEESQMMIPVGNWLLKQACLQGLAWQKEGLNESKLLTLSVNLSPIQLQAENLVDYINDILVETGFPPEHLELEITESAIINRLEQTIGKLKALRALGVSISMDDFGTGYSSLNYLKRLPVQKLKIDQSFVRDLKVDSAYGNVVDSVIHLGHNLGLFLIAEGIETKEQMEYLRDAGCDEGQGFYFSKPLSKDAFAEFIQKFNNEE